MTDLHHQLENQPDLACAVWRKSSYSGTSGNCVEVATNLAGIVAMRDSKDPDGTKLVVSVSEWQVFVGGVRAGEFGLQLAVVDDMPIAILASPDHQQ